MILVTNFQKSFSSAKYFCTILLYTKKVEIQNVQNWQDLPRYKYATIVSHSRGPIIILLRFPRVAFPVPGTYKFLWVIKGMLPCSPRFAYLYCYSTKDYSNQNNYIPIRTSKNFWQLIFPRIYKLQKTKTPRELPWLQFYSQFKSTDKISRDIITISHPLEKLPKISKFYLFFHNPQNWSIPEPFLLGLG